MCSNNNEDRATNKINMSANAITIMTYWKNRMGSIAGWEGMYNLILLFCQGHPKLFTVLSKSISLKSVAYTNTGVVLSWEFQQSR